jgi:hypothetical protein
MTVLVALLCKDGAILGADQAMSSVEGSLRLCETPTSKIRIFDDGFGGLATAGAVGAGQLAEEALRSLPRGPNASKWTPVRVLSEVQKALVAAPHSMLDALKTMKMGPSPDGLKTYSRESVGDGIYVQAVGTGTAARPAVVCYEGAHTAVLLEDNKVIFNTLGSGSVLAQPYVSVIRGLLFPDRLPTMEEGLLSVYWALKHVIQYRAGGGVGGDIDIATFEFDREDRLRMCMADEELTERIGLMFSDLQTAIKSAFRGITDRTSMDGAMASEPDAAPPPRMT